MTTIFYKKILGHYEISDVTQISEKGIKFRFEEPFDGKLLISNSIFDIVRGVCEIQDGYLSDGEISPKIYTGSGMQRIEGFLISREKVIRQNPNADYVRNLSATVDSLLCRIQKLEEALGKIENKIERKITF